MSRAMGGEPIIDCGFWICIFGRSSFDDCYFGAESVERLGDIVGELIEIVNEQNVGLVRFRLGF